MIAKRYETRIDSDGLIAIEKVWSKRIPDLPADTQFRDPTVVCHLCKILRMHAGDGFRSGPAQYQCGLQDSDPVSEL